MASGDGNSSEGTWIIIFLVMVVALMILAIALVGYAIKHKSFDRERLDCKECL
jgi:sensor domain CHASE-containing protein